MVLRGGERQHVLAVDEGEEARLLALQEFLDDDLGAGCPEGAGEAGVDGGFSASRPVSAMTTPLPAASPSALITIGRVCVAR